VAPHEADAQLAFLNQQGIANVIITEDSDLILFGCSQVLLANCFSKHKSKSFLLKDFVQNGY
jgi:5'-3' exonuclease